MRNLMEDKELLLRDLCSRLPYGVKCQIDIGDADVYVDTLTNITTDGFVSFMETIDTEDVLGYGNIKPLLFPMSSMTEEQRIEASLELGLKKYTINIFGDIESYSEIGDDIAYIDIESINRYINWCYKNHIDINNLIPKGLANDVTNLNIY